jgi:SAM-dependent methyltransferase
VLELGFGDGLNALIMAQLGAEVTAVEISKYAVQLLATASKELRLQHRIEPICGDFIEIDLPPSYYDFVVGKAFLHHLTHEVEREYVAKASVVLRPSGEARFCEPAVNSRLLDFLRWMIPVSGRPSILMRHAFQKWKERDPHPVRDNSSRHYENLFQEYFRNVEIWPIGCLERFHRILPTGEFNLEYRRWAFRLEFALIPYPIRLRFARAQTIVARGPKK